MDPLSGFKNEVFRPIATLVLPGMVASGLLAIALGNEVPEIAMFYEKHSTPFFLLLLAVYTTVGLLLENLGSSIERGIDRCMECEYLTGCDAVWAAYLGASTNETFAKKYLGTLVTRLKFLNSMIPALLLFIAGLIWIHLQTDKWSNVSVGVAVGIVFLVVSWLFKTSTELSEAALFARLKILPAGAEVSVDTTASSVSRFRHLAYVLIELRTSRVSEFNLKGRGGLAATAIVALVAIGGKWLAAKAFKLQAGAVVQSVLDKVASESAAGSRDQNARA